MEQLSYNKIKKVFVSNRMIKKKLKKIIKKKFVLNIIKQETDNKYLKFIEFSDNCLIFKTNKKFRDKESDDPSFSSNYIFNFLSKIFYNIGINVTSSQLYIICDIYKDNNKILVEF